MQYGLSTAEHSVHTTGAYGRTGISGIGLHGVHTAPNGNTTRVASIREEGQAFQLSLTPSRCSSAVKSMTTTRRVGARRARPDPHVAVSIDRAALSFTMPLRGTLHAF